MSELERLYEAARAYPRMGADLPKQSRSGKWKLSTFEIDQREEMVERLRAQIRASKHGGEGADHFVPQGRYVVLKRRVTPHEVMHLVAPRGAWVPVMSDTPNEIEDHDEPLRHARGRVLIHGLGLGCIVGALLAKPDVEQIDVVEVDPEVIALTGPYYQDARVTIHEGDCMTYPWPDDATWDYAWHDIWSQISPRNLDPLDAEHGISYGMLFNRFRHRAAHQGAWAFERALRMDARERLEEGLAERFIRQWRLLTPGGRYQELLARQFRHPFFGDDGPDAETVEAYLEKAAPDLLAKLRRASENPDLKPIEAKMLLNFVD